MDIVIPPVDIQLGKVLGPSESVDEFRNKWDQVVIFDCHCIQSLVVLHQPNGAIFLLNEEYWGCHWLFGRANVPQMKVFLKESIKLSLFVW